MFRFPGRIPLCAARRPLNAVGSAMTGQRNSGEQVQGIERFPKPVTRFRAA